MQGGQRGGTATGRDDATGHRPGAEEGSPRVVVHLLGGALDVEDVLLAQVDVLVEEEGGQVALEVTAVLHHHRTGHRVASDGEEAERKTVMHRRKWLYGAVMRHLQRQFLFNTMKHDTNDI